MYPAQTHQPYPQYPQYPVQQNYGHHPAQYPAYPPPYSPAQPAAYPAQGYPAPYPAGQYCPSGQCPTQQNVIYRQEHPRRSNWMDNPKPNNCWLLSLLALCCGCFMGEALCDQPCCCCLIPCALPRFR